MYKNMEELIKDEELLVSLVETKTADEFVAILEEKGIKLDGITEEEAFEAFHSQKDAKEGELDESALNDVAGGFFDPVSQIAIWGTVGVCSWLGATAYGAYKYASKRKRR